MNQVNKFYWASFLKNQTYFTPIMILFLQFYNLTFQEVFWVFTIGSIISFIIEVPTGVIADLYGKRKSIILSKILITIAFVSFGFSSTFIMFVISQILYELGQAFRSGTETAYTYDYLEQTKDTPSYSEVKGKQKFWARVGESISAAIGGFIAAMYGFNFVFFVAALPAFINFLINLTWVKIKEHEDDVTIKYAIYHSFDSIKNFKEKKLRTITINIMLFTSILAALNKFIQPYMTDASVPIEWFGIIYSVSLAITAIAVRYSYIIENKFGKRKTINTLSFLAFIPVLIIGFGYNSMYGVLLFFLVVIIENIRSPIANHEFHKNVASKNRATMGSILSLGKSLGKIGILPLAGYFADVFSMYTSILVMSVLLIINALFFYVRKE